jgi:hypothetical protein
MQYFVVMIDYGRRGREAVVDPEITRREVVARVACGEYKNISLIHEIADRSVDDVTEEILAEAALPELATAEPDLQASPFDHARDLKKHETRDDDAPAGPGSAGAVRPRRRSHQQHGGARRLAGAKIGMRPGGVLQRIGLVHLDLDRA